jgi:hypothetical protein
VSLGLDVSAIEAQALSLAAPDFELLEKLIASARSQFNRTLRGIAEYRTSFALLLSEAAQPIIAGKAAAIEDLSSKRKPG